MPFGNEPVRVGDFKRLIFLTAIKALQDMVRGQQCGRDEAHAAPKTSGLAKRRRNSGISRGDASRAALNSRHFCGDNVNWVRSAKAASAAACEAANHEFCEDNATQAGSLNNATFYLRCHPEIDACGCNEALAMTGNGFDDCAHNILTIRWGADLGQVFLAVGGLRCSATLPSNPR